MHLPVLYLEMKSVPTFKQGDYYSGIAAGINAILLATRGEYQGDGGKKGKGTRYGNSFHLFNYPFIILSTIFRKGGRGGGSGILPWIVLSSMGNSRRSGGWGSGGGEGGGFGGFSGGGGSFGGGERKLVKY